MNIVLAIETLSAGGAETFVQRLAAALQERGHHVVIFSFYKEIYRKEIHMALAPSVNIIWPEIPSLYKKADSLLFRLKIDYSFRAAFVLRSYSKFLQAFKPDIIHSHLMKVDTISLQAAKPFNLPVITTIHGDYLQFYNKSKQGVPIPILNYETKAKANLEGLDKIVCISDKQLAFFNEHFSAETQGKLVKIYNGYERTAPIGSRSNELRAAIGLHENDFVFGMVSRGIPEKGWEVAIRALLQLADDRFHLILVGEGSYLEALKQKYETYRNIHFTGHSNEPLEWINIFDVGLLPSTYASESLPTVVIEYLYCGKPVIASDAGELKNMITAGDKKAGTIISVKNNEIDAAELAGYMLKYTDKEYYRAQQQHCSACFEQFDMDKCIERYTSIYENSK